MLRDSQIKVIENSLEKKPQNEKHLNVFLYRMTPANNFLTDALCAQSLFKKRKKKKKQKQKKKFSFKHVDITVTFFFCIKSFNWTMAQNGLPTS